MRTVEHVDEKVGHIMDGNAVSTQYIDERVMLGGCPSRPRQVVEQEIVTVLRNDLRYLGARAVHYRLIEYSRLRRNLKA
jgi:hypothetical protein